MTNSLPIPVILSARRTPIGSMLGAISTVSAHDLGAVAIGAALQDAHIAPHDVDEVIMGQVLTAAQGQNPARQAALNSGIPQEKTALCINQLCGSGLRAVAMASQAVSLDPSAVLVAGGQENMSASPHAMSLRTPTKMGAATMVDTMVVDGLWCASNGYHMGNTAENIAEKWQLSREEQDTFALKSQNKVENAIKSGKFGSQIVPVEVKGRKETKVIDQDEFPRFGATLESLTKLRPAFNKNGTVTAGNASGINDGAAACVVTTMQRAEEMGVKPLARIVSWATAGVDPAIMGTGPIPASRLALERAGWTVKDLDLIEANEAFAAQALAVNKDMEFPAEKVNVHGGAIALGHPIGASGARVLVTLLHALAEYGQSRGLATLCIGGGMGIALCVERIQ